MNSDDLDKKLDRLSRFFTTPGNSTAAPQSDSLLNVGTYPPRYQKLAERLGGELVSSETGAFCLVTTCYPYGHRFGNCKLDVPSSDLTLLNSAFLIKESDREHRLADLLFFDTETTGLGGSGAVAFLIGLGCLTASGFEIRQYVLPDYSDEAALLESVLAECADHRTLVSYNGTAFDVPLVRDRMIINRVDRGFDPPDHLDLLHPTRRLFRRRLGDCTLTNIEREIFAFYREDDIPGYLIPSVYFEWLNSESSGMLAQVLEHNRLDVLTLYFLARYIHEAYVTDGRSLGRADDIYSLSRIYGRRKQHDRVVDIYRVIDGTAEELAADARLYHAMAMKRAGRIEDALGIWEALVGDGGREAFVAALELAKYYEHRVKDYGRALSLARRAAELAPDSANCRQELERRFRRLEARLSAGG
ncbi:MAG: ribonuclease H-like domain-containing protein [candidate division Zixibacteria bacterium]|jgi:uncharacterized protein YprB with RNaseH-like and TPR domain|nr:ribonuclease H-like domain-containing protein [candidate division Zixibacteria bacterium]